ncbi:DUF6622 family protein [Priestia endophytica]|uniref:DUF6622 family protein n=1 Tax=Priestia filamentosa TaxID=1402861 RepID=UPI002E22968F|nr:hypothetical protein [Priestia filamentosa]
MNTTIKERLLSTLFWKETLLHTPLWVWLLLIILIRMGIATSKERPVHFSRMFLAPLIFMIWGLWTITSTFSHLGYSLISYIVFIFPGVLIAYLLYSKYQSFFKKGTVTFKKKSYLPLFIILINFVVKYLLNVLLSSSPTFYNDTLFNIIYSSINGLSVGLFFGGILYTFYMQSRLNRSTLES